MNAIAQAVNDAPPNLRLAMAVLLIVFVLAIWLLTMEE